MGKKRKERGEPCAMLVMETRSVNGMARVVIFVSWGLDKVEPERKSRRSLCVGSAVALHTHPGVWFERGHF
jgi:hypothetical protein